jgi:hypothetical protein
VEARNPAAIDNLMVDDFVLTTGGVDVVSTKKGPRDRENVLSGNTSFKFSTGVTKP